MSANISPPSDGGHHPILSRVCLYVSLEEQWKTGLKTAPVVNPPSDLGSPLVHQLVSTWSSSAPSRLGQQPLQRTCCTCLHLLESRTAVISPPFSGTRMKAYWQSMCTASAFCFLWGGKKSTNRIKCWQCLPATQCVSCAARIQNSAQQLNGHGRLFVESPQLNRGWTACGSGTSLAACERVDDASFLVGQRLALRTRADAPAALCGELPLFARFVPSCRACWHWCRDGQAEESSRAFAPAPFLSPAADEAVSAGCATRHAIGGDLK